MLARELQLQLAEKAGRAPSPHNIQPARWRFGGHDVELHELASRWLRVGDPTGRDNRIALGMAWEGMAIAVSEHGWTLGEPMLDAAGYPADTATRVIARAQLLHQDKPDPLVHQLERRRCYRGVFADSDPQQVLRRIGQCVAGHCSSVSIIPDKLRPSIAAWHDGASADGLRDPQFARELYQWMRFSPRNPQWQRDGLAADCLGLSTIETWGAAVAMHPTVVRVLAAAGLAKTLVSEADKVRSAAALVLLHCPATLGDFAFGRAWYRFWLELAQADLCGVPMSALADSQRHSQLLVEACPLPAEHRLINVMRIGVAPGAIARSARLPARELLL